MHLNALYSKMSIEDMDKKNESSGNIQLTQEMLDQALNQPPVNPVITKRKMAPEDLTRALFEKNFDDNGQFRG